MVILLDIDGVMVPAKSWSSPPLLDDGFYMFNSKAVAALNDIILKSNAGILLTTSHKSSFTLDKWKSIFSKRGISVDSIDRLPENTNHLSRLEEITKWFSTAKNIEDFVIIDDDKSLNELPKLLKSRLVQTKPLVGLNSSHVRESLRILETPLELV